MDSVTLKLIDRRKRIRNKIFSFLILMPLGIFFIGCFRVSRHSNYRTIFEEEFGFDTYWRIIGVAGLIVVVVLFLTLDELWPFKKGKILLTADKIKIENGLRVHEFSTNKLSEFELRTDVPFGGDDRLDFQKASVLKFRDNNKKYDFEIGIETRIELEALTPIVKSWKETNIEFKYRYK